MEGVGRADPADGEGAGVAPREVRVGDEAEEVAEAEAADEGLLTRRPAVASPGVMAGEQQHPADDEDGGQDRAARPDRRGRRAASPWPGLPVPCHVRRPLTGGLTSARRPPGLAARG